MATDSMNPEMATTEDQETATDSMNSEMATTEDQEMATDSMNSEMATTEDQETATDSMNPEIISGEITGCPKLECQSGIKVSPVIDEKQGTTVSIAGKVIGRLPVLLCQMCTQSAPSHSWVDIMDSIVDFDLEIDLLAAETSNFADQFMEHVGIDLEQFSTQPDPFLEPDPEKVKTEAPSETNVSLQPRFAALISTEKRCTPLLKANHKKSCLQYAEPSLSNPQTFWYTVLWTDDSSLVLWIRRFVQHRRNQACTEKNTLSTVKHGGGSVMLWGCFVSNGTGNLYRVDGIVDSTKYRDILAKNVHPEAQPQNYMYMMDDDPEDQSEAAWSQENAWLGRLEQIWSDPGVDHYSRECTHTGTPKGVQFLTSEGDELNFQFANAMSGFCGRFGISLLFRELTTGKRESLTVADILLTEDDVDLLNKRLVVQKFDSFKWCSTVHVLEMDESKTSDNIQILLQCARDRGVSDSIQDQISQQRLHLRISIDPRLGLYMVSKSIPGHFTFMSDFISPAQTSMSGVNRRRCTAEGTPDNLPVSAQCTAERTPNDLLVSAQCTAEGTTDDLPVSAQCTAEGTPNDLPVSAQCTAEGTTDNLPVSAQCTAEGTTDDLPVSAQCTAVGTPNDLPVSAQCTAEGTADNLPVSAQCTAVGTPDDLPVSAQCTAEGTTDDLPVSAQCTAEGTPNDLPVSAQCTAEGTPNDLPVSAQCTAEGTTDNLPVSAQCTAEGTTDDLPVSAQCTAVGTPNDLPVSAQCTAEGTADNLPVSAQCTAVGTPDDLPVSAQCTAEGTTDDLPVSAQCTAVGTPDDLPVSAQCTAVGTPDDLPVSAQCTAEGTTDDLPVSAQCTAEGTPNDLPVSAQCTAVGTPDDLPVSAQCTAEGTADNLPVSAQCTAVGTTDDLPVSAQCTAEGTPNDLPVSAQCTAVGTPDDLPVSAQCTAEGTADNLPVSAQCTAVGTPDDLPVSAQCTAEGTPNDLPVSAQCTAVGTPDDLPVSAQCTAEGTADNLPVSAQCTAVGTPDDLPVSAQCTAEGTADNLPVSAQCTAVGTPDDLPVSAQCTAVGTPPPDTPVSRGPAPVIPGGGNLALSKADRDALQETTDAAVGKVLLLEQWFGKLGEPRSVKGCIELVENPDRSNIKLHVSQKNVQQLQVMQNKAARLVLHCDFKTPVQQLHASLSWQTVKERILVNTVSQLQRNGDVDDGYVSRDEWDPPEEEVWEEVRGAVRDAYPGGEDGAGHINTNNRPTKQTDADDFFEDKVKDPRDNQELSTTRWREIANAPRSGKRLHGGGRKVTNPEKDRSLVEWLEGLRDKGVAVNGTMMKIQAKKLSGGGDSFRVSNGWLCCLKKGYGLSTRRKTSATEKLPQDFEDKVLSFQRRMIPLREQCDYPMCDVFNMDETPLTFDMPSDWTHWEERL
ncbi:hypothetical protein Bbelb_284090 [Branchiostoma belcheri]|nr:hypothetical protein Bbelb_284090 [Branchiostoma belcheri]